jgi:hypothetical protein
VLDVFRREALVLHNLHPSTGENFPDPWIGMALLYPESSGAFLDSLSG